MGERPKLTDPADKGTDQFVMVHRNGGWTVEQWIAYLGRWPHATLPSGVGRMIVDHYKLQYDRLHDVTYRLDGAACNGDADAVNELLNEFRALSPAGTPEVDF